MNDVFAKLKNPHHLLLMMRILSSMKSCSDCLVINADAFEVPFIQPVDALVDFHLVMPAEAVQLADIRELA